MKLWDVEIGDDFYLQALEIRRNLLFNGLHEADVYMNDPWENKSMHVVVEHLSKLIGVGRLTNDKDGNGIISQMAVLQLYQKQNVGSMIMEYLVKVCIYKSVKKIYMSARETSIGFYEKFGFNSIGGKFNSPKTGITQVSMVLEL